MGLLDLTGLLAQLELEELLPRLTGLGGNLGGRQFADFFRSHDGSKSCFWLGRGSVALNETAVEGKFRVGETERLLGNGHGHAREFEQDGAGLDDRDIELDRPFAL